jgi:hypothetical protein
MNVLKIDKRLAQKGMSVAQVGAKGNSGAHRGIF